MIVYDVSYKFSCASVGTLLTGQVWIDDQIFHLDTTLHLHCTSYYHILYYLLWTTPFCR